MEATAKNYEIIHAVTRYPLLYTLKLGCSNITLREPCNNQLPRCDIDVILHGFMLQIIYTTVFRVKWLNIFSPTMKERKSIA